jgi:cytosine/creatinine deaminase
MPKTLLLKNVRPLAAETTDVLVTDGFISQIAPNLAAPDTNTTVLDGQNQILIPGLVEGHTHLDKTLLGLAWHKHQAGPTLKDKIDHERKQLREMNHDSHKQAAKQVKLSISRGTTHIRTHVDVDTDKGISHIEGVMATRAELKDYVDMQIVAFPQSGLLVRPGTLELMEEAVKLGAEVVGGIDPMSFDRDPKGHLDAIFNLAHQYGREIDIHLHDPAELGAVQVEMIAERTKALSMKGKVAISHAFCLGMVDEAYLQKLIELLRENDIAIMTHAPGNRLFPPILRLKKEGIRLFSGSDGIRDTWSPYGNADMLERAWILSYRSGFRYDHEIEVTLDMVTQGGAAVVGAKNYGISEGCQADMVVVSGETLAEAVINRLPRKFVFKKGQLVATDGQITLPD